MSYRFNVGVVVALVAGGIGALLLATALALGGYGRTGSRATSPSAAGAAPRASAVVVSPSETEVDYLPEASE
jgi:hypothetical protein